MSALDWATPLAALDAALVAGTTSAGEAIVGAAIRAELFEHGTAYDAHWTPELDAAKTESATATAAALAAWTASATILWDAADLFARYCETLIPPTFTEGAARAFDATAEGHRREIARLELALSHTSAAEAVVSRDYQARLYASIEAKPTGVVQTKWHYVRSDSGGMSMAAREAQLQLDIDKANAWITASAFVP